MKKLFTALLILLLLITAAGCQKNSSDTPTPSEPETDIPEKEPDQPAVCDLKYRTFYNTRRISGEFRSSYITFGGEGEFRIVEYGKEDPEFIDGTWKANGIECVLTVGGSTSGSFNKIVFEILEDETLLLKSQLITSVVNDEFSEKTSSVTYYNTANGGKKGSSLKLGNDGTFALTEVKGDSKKVIEGMFGREKDALMFSNFEVFESLNKEKVYNFTLLIGKDGLTLNDDLICSKKGDLFTTDGEKTSAELPESHWIHAPIEDVLSDYLPSVDFNSDGTFVFTENCYNGFGYYNGTWEITQKGYVCHVTDASSMEGRAGADVKEIVFEVKGEGVLVLKTNLCMSMDGDEFDSRKLHTVIYYNASMDSPDKSRIELTNNGTFRLVEVNGTGELTVEGVYGKDMEFLMFSNFPAFDDFNGNKVQNFEFQQMPDGSLVLNEDLMFSHKGDVFTIDGKLPETPQPGGSGVRFVHEPIEDVNESYLPEIVLEDNGRFVLTENCYAGMGQYLGTWKIKDNFIKLTVDDASSMQGFTGGDVKEITFELNGENVITLKTDLCMSRNGDRFRQNNTTRIIYINSSQDSDPAYIELTSDGKFAMAESSGKGWITIEGVYGQEGPYLMFSNFTPFEGADGELIENFEFEQKDQGVIELLRDLCNSKKGDLFTVTGD